MEAVDRHPFEPDTSFDGGDLDCGNGLLLLIRQHIDPLERGQLLEFRSTEISVEEVCRGNWTRDERVALAGDYRPLLSLLQRLAVGTLFLELATPRAGEIEVLAELPADCRVGIGVVNQKHDRVETVAEIVARAERAMKVLGPGRVLLTPDCGFATFADNPVASATVAEAKLRAIAQAALMLRRG